MDFKTELLTEFLNCGYGDLDFLEKEMNLFEVEISDLDISMDDEFNSVIRSIYEVALSKFNVYTCDEEWETRVEIFVNFIDSHLWIDGEEMICLEDIKKFFEKNK